MLVKYNPKKTELVRLCVPLDSHSELNVLKCGTVNLSTNSSTCLNVMVKNEKICFKNL